MSTPPRAVPLRARPAPRRRPAAGSAAGGRAPSAIRSRRRSSPGDSTVTTRTPASTAAASSSSRLPGPVNTTRSAPEPGPQDVPQLAAGRHVRAEAQPGEVPQHGEVRVGLDRVGEVERRRQDRPERLDLARDHVQVVGVERRPEPLGELGRVVPAESAVAQDLVHRSASSRATRASVPASRSLTRSATETDRPLVAANSPPRVRDPGTTTAPRRHGERRLRRAGQHPPAHQVVEPRGPGEDDARPDDRALAHQHALEQRRSGPHERPVLHDDRPRAGRLQDPADRHPGREVDARADLGAGAHEHVAVHHRVLTDPRADVDERGRHDHDPRAQVHAGPDRGPARDHPPRTGEQVLDREPHAVPEPEGATQVPLDRRPVPEAVEDGGLDLGVRAPAARGRRVGDGRPATARVEVGEDGRREAGRHGRRLDGRHAATSPARSPWRPPPSTRPSPRSSPISRSRGASASGSSGARSVSSSRRPIASIAAFAGTGFGAPWKFARNRGR